MENVFSPHVSSRKSNALATSGSLSLSSCYQDESPFLLFNDGIVNDFTSAFRSTQQAYLVRDISCVHTRNNHISYRDESSRWRWYCEKITNRKVILSFYRPWILHREQNTTWSHLEYFTRNKEEVWSLKNILLDMFDQVMVLNVVVFSIYHSISNFFVFNYGHFNSSVSIELCLI